MGQTGTGSSEKGTALYAVITLLFLLLAVSSAFHTVTTASKREVEAVQDTIRRLYIAESGVVHALMDMNQGGTGNVGSPGAPVSFGGGGYWVVTTANPDGTYSMSSHGTSRGEARVLEAVVQDVSRGVFQNAVFAGNSDDDPAYSLDLGGAGSYADDVDGSVYSGGDLAVAGDAGISGTARAVGTLTGVSGDTGVRLPDLGVSTMNFETNHDVDVAADFATNGTYQSAVSGGDAWQVPEEHPAHIFRKNPSDRTVETGCTAKDDYFLEDPYETSLGGGAKDDDGHSAYEGEITVAGLPGEPGTDGNDLVYYIDGNLWVHSKYLHRVKFETSAGSGVHVTFVVKGNIYVMDDIRVEKETKDGVAFVAMKDDAVPDSGNIYFGDAALGTLEEADAFFYAEGCFHEGNTDAAAKPSVHLKGVMSAGNRVEILRETDGSRSRLNLDFDSRVMDGDLVLPGLPSAAGAGNGGSDNYRVLATTEVSH